LFDLVDAAAMKITYILSDYAQEDKLSIREEKREAAAAIADGIGH
jgi:hypothetical protein